jgi:serine/threonine protein kinase
MNEANQGIETIFHAAKGLPVADQGAYLEMACRNHPETRREVERLLGAAAKADGIFEGKPAGLTELSRKTIFATPIEEKAGANIGRYKLLQQIGEGGMGVVYMAEQQEPVRRRVALKIIKLGMDTKQVVARFEAERQALALMDHPNIARVLDGGATETGRPYFVMELVQGVPITEFCDKSKLSTHERLKLFIQVCQAIQSAHQKGIIHRDIKPSNVLVTLHDGVPVPKVIDFGVAKATNQRLTEKTLFTNFATMIGTPAYMSPEQAEMSGLDIDTRADIYALGVLLYALLTGTTPFPEKRLRSLGYGEMQRVILEEEPERPSTRLSAMAKEEKTAVAKNCGQEIARIRNLLAGDLDWIVMKCLEKDRARRYETANGLAADLNRHLANEPVAARPPSVFYLTRKFLKRRRHYALALGLGCALVGLAAVIESQSRQAEILRKSNQLESLRREESAALTKVIARLAMTEAEKNVAKACLARLADRVRNGGGSPSDRELLARFLARDFELDGRRILETSRPAITLDEWLGQEYVAEGVGVVLSATAALDGVEIPIGGQPKEGDHPYPSHAGARHRGSGAGASAWIRLDTLAILPGMHEVTTVLLAQLVHCAEDRVTERGVDGDVWSVGRNWSRGGGGDVIGPPIGDPIRIPLQSAGRLFVNELPNDYPVGITGQPGARGALEGAKASDLVVNVKTDGSRAVRFTLELSNPGAIPGAFEAVLETVGATPVMWDLGGLVISKDGRSTHFEVIGKDGGIARAVESNRGITKAHLEFSGRLPDATDFQDKGAGSSAIITLTSSRQVALLAGLECYALAPEVKLSVPVVFNAGKK